MKSNAQKVAELNTLWGNVKGDLSNPNVKALRKQAKLCIEESAEAYEAADTNSSVVVSYQAKLANADINPVDLVGIADSIGDMLTVAYGLAHCAGFDADKIYDLVHESNMTKFIPSEDDVLPALNYYWNLGYPDGSLAVEGTFPQAYIRVLQTVQVEGKEIPEGKILKNMVTFKEPNFYSLMPDYDPNASLETKVKDTLDHMKSGIA